ncbi:MAG: DnaJ domain-containing protein [Cyanobacteria bacterium P01_F01_bin.150]
MTNLDQYYALLNIKRGASEQEIKQAYLRLAKQWHPDKFPYNSEERRQAEETFKAINEAYDHLKEVAISSSSPTPGQATESSQASSYRVRTHQAKAENVYEEAIALANQEQVSEAIDALSQAIRLNPNFIKAYQYRAFLHEQLGHLNQATSDFETVKRLKVELVEISWKQPAATSQTASNTNAYTQAKATGQRATNTPLDFTATKIHSMHSHTAGVTDMAFNEILGVFASSSLDGSITIWNPRDQRVLSTLKTGDNTPIYTVQSVPKISRIVSAGQDGTMRFWDLRLMKISYTLGKWFDGHQGAIYSLAIGPNGQTMLSGGQDQCLKLWSIYKGSVQKTFEYSYPVTAIALSPKTHQFVSNGMGTRLEIRRFPYGTMDGTLDIEERPRAIAFHPSGTELAVGYDDGRVQLWSLKTQSLSLTMAKHGETITSLDFSSDGQYLLSSSEDQSCVVWNLSTGSPMVTLSGSSAILTSRFCLANDSILSGDREGNIHLWHLAQDR